jgi:hypothetical protein
MVDSCGTPKEARREEYLREKKKQLPNVFDHAKIILRKILQFYEETSETLVIDIESKANKLTKTKLVFNSRKSTKLLNKVNEL